MMYLDTHVIVFLHKGDLDVFPKKALKYLKEYELRISPIVSMELQFLFEIKRIAYSPNEMIDELIARLGLSICSEPMMQIVQYANQLTWTRDPFDRLIVANALSKNALLLTKDNKIREYYAHAVWD